MKWKLISVLIISLMSISVIGCWPPFAAPPPPPPPPMHLFEDHYLRYEGPYNERNHGLTHMASHTSQQSLQPISGHHMNPHLFYPIPSVNPIPPMSYSEPQERIYSGNDFDFGNTQEFVGYIPREPAMMKVRHMNYKYRKRMKTQRPIEENNNFQKEVKFSQNLGSIPRRYNVIDSRGEYQKRIPNSLNEKHIPNIKKSIDEEESTPQNSSLNTFTKSNTKTKDLEENGSQNKDISEELRHPITDMPIEVKSYAMKSPDGAVTQVTEMLYDVENNPFKVPTTTPILTPIWKPSQPLHPSQPLQPFTPLVKPFTEQPFVTQTPYLSNAFSETDTTSTAKTQPINTAVTAQFNDITMSPVLSFTSQRNAIEVIPTVFTPSEVIHTPTPPRLKSSSSSDYYSKRNRKKMNTEKPFSTTPRNSARESKPGLSGAAIAGIVIGSMVSIMLLAGTSLFVLYRNPFRRSMSPQRNTNLPNVTPNDNSVPRVHRWQPRRQRRL